VTDLTFVEFYLEPLKAVAFLAAWGLGMLTILVVRIVR